MTSYEELMSIAENNHFLCTIDENGVKLANQIIEMIEKAREGNDNPSVGDIVKYTDKDTTYENLVDMAMNGSITLLYTTLDEDELLEVV